MVSTIIGLASGLGRPSLRRRPRHVAAPSRIHPNWQRPAISASAWEIPPDALSYQVNGRHATSRRELAAWPAVVFVDKRSIGFDLVCLQQERTECVIS